MPAPDWFAQLLSSELSHWVQLSEHQVGQLHQHYDLLLRWNQRMNLTTVKAGPEMVIRHYCESLFFAAHIPEERSQISLLDLGSGAGFPGVPVAVLKPEWQVGLVESSQRKAVFLRESSRHLRNVTVLSERIDHLSKTADWVVSRAVDPAEVLAVVPSVAPDIGLMLGEDDFSSVENASRIAWRERVRLPWGDRKICVYGSVPV